MNDAAQTIHRTIKETALLDHHSTGALLVEVARRLPMNTEVKITGRKIRVQHTEHVDRLVAADPIDDALASNGVLFS